MKPSDEQLQLAAVRQAAGKLKLQSVVRGDEPRAVINGQLLAKGQGIAGFTLIRIQQRAVILERQGIRIRLGM